MSPPVLPVVLEPVFKAKPWGGRALETALGKTLPPDTPIGESWEVASLPEGESRVRHGPLAGRTLGELLAAWGPACCGAAPLSNGRFPLLIKYLDAREDLSVQVHPRPYRTDGTPNPGVKHEAWYVLHAEPGAKIYVGLRAGVTPADLERAANTPALVDLLQAWPVASGECFNVPSGTLHALGAGVLVAEVQTPSDVTYRAYDWGRVGLDGKPRELHIAQTLENTRFDVTSAMIRQPAQEHVGLWQRACRIVHTERFVIDVLHADAGWAADIPAGTLRIWMVLDGRATLAVGAERLALRRGDVALLPAGAPAAAASFSSATKWLEVTIPVAPQ